MADHTNQSGLSSKKFLAFMVSCLGWDILLGVMIYKYCPLDQWSTIVILSMVVVQGVVQVGYIIGQAGLDALRSLFEIITPDSIFGAKKKPAAEAKKPDEEAEVK